MKALWFLLPVVLVTAALVFGRPLPVRDGERNDAEGGAPPPTG